MFYQEKSKSEAVVFELSRYLKYNDLFDKIEKFSTDLFTTKMVYFSNWIKIEISYLNSIDYDKLYFPLFRMDFYMEKKYLKDNNIVKIIDDIYDLFYWLWEEDYLLDYLPTFHYRWVNLLSKVYPKHKFIDVNMLESDYINDKWEQIINNYLKEKSKHPEYNSDSYNSFEEFRDYFNYIMYSYHNLFVFLVESSSVKNEIEDLRTNNNSYFWNKLLFSKRLSNLQSDWYIIFKNYWMYIDSFFQLFSK